MSSIRLLTDSESAVFAGVSVDTIREYDRMGLLRAANREGPLLFTEDQLRAVFQIPDSRHAPAGHSIAPDRKLETPTQKSPAPPEEQKQEAAQPSSTEEAKAEQQPLKPTPQAAKPAEAHRPERQEPRHSTITYTNPGAHNSYDLLEVNRTLRDQIEMLRDEREWLRKRVEVLETRTERDQMLLLSETKTVQHLVTTTRPRAGFWSLLPWFKTSEKQ